MAQSELDNLDIDNIAPLRINEDARIKQSNRLINSSYYLNLVEQKIVFAIVSQLVKDGDSLDITRINVADLARLCGFRSNNAYKQVREATISLMERVIRIKSEKDGGEYLTHWVQSCRYFPADNEHDACMVYHLDESIKDDLLRLRKAYVTCRLVDVFKLSSQYAMRLYLVALEWEKVGKFTYSPEKFRHAFGLDKKKSYSTIGNLKARVIDVAVTQINEQTDLIVSYEMVKAAVRGNKIAQIVFRIKRKNPAILADNTPSETDIEAPPIDPADKLEAPARQYLDRLVEVGQVTRNVAIELLEKYSVEHCRANLEHVRKQKAYANNFGGMVVKAIREDWAGQELAQRKKREAHERENEQREREAYDLFHGTHTATTSPDAPSEPAQTVEGSDTLPCGLTCKRASEIARTLAPRDFPMPPAILKRAKTELAQAGITLQELNDQLAK